MSDQTMEDRLAALRAKLDEPEAEAEPEAVEADAEADADTSDDAE
jgi:hypothetical protein